MKNFSAYAMAVLFAVAFLFVSSGMAADTVPPPENVVKEIKKSIRPPAPPSVEGESSFSRRAFRAHRRQLRRFNALRANWGGKALDDAALSELTGNLGLPLFLVSPTNPAFRGGRYIRLYSTYLLVLEGKGTDSDPYAASIVPLVFIESAYTKGSPTRFAPLDFFEPYGSEFSADLTGEAYSIYALDGTPPFFFDEDFRDYWTYGSPLRYWVTANWPYDTGGDIYVYGPYPEDWALAGWTVGGSIADHRIRYRVPEAKPNVTVIVKDGEFHYSTLLDIYVEHVSAYDDDGCGDGVGSYWTWGGISLRVPVNDLVIGGRGDRNSWLYVKMPTSTIDFAVRGIYIDDKITYTGNRSLGALQAHLTLNANIYLTTHK